MQFRRKRPGWLLPTVAGLVILGIWISLGLLADEGQAPSASNAAAARLLVYLSPSDRPAEVYAWDFGSQQNAQLTDSGGVASFAVDPGGNFLVLSIHNGDGGLDLWRADLTSGSVSPLLECSPASCRDPRLSPAGAQLAYVRREPGQDATEIWLLDLLNDEHRRLSAEGHLSRDPAWATPSFLGYYDQTLAAYVLVSLDNGPLEEYDNETGGQASWHPGGGYLVAAEQSPVSTGILRGPSGEAAFDTPAPGSQSAVSALSSQLMRYENGAGTLLIEYSDLLIEDAAPVFSPDGGWLAFTRKYLDEERWTPGRQLWLLNVESGELRQLTDSPNHQVIAIAWSPDGQQLAYVRSNQVSFQEPLELWVSNLDGSASQLIAVDAYAPAWVP